MAATNRKEFAKVDIGPLAEKLRKSAKEGTTIGFSELDIIVRKFDKPDTAVLFPTRYRIFGLNCYTFAVQGHAVLVKVDQRPFPNDLSGISLLTSRDIHALSSKFEDSPEFRAMLKLVKTKRPDQS